MRREEERSERKRLSELSRFIFESDKCFARKNWRKLYERWEPASS